MLSLLRVLKKFYPVTEELSQQLYVIVGDAHYKRYNLLLREGEVDRHIWFIEKGLVALLRNDKVTHILDADHFVIAPDSWATGCPTGFTIQALEDTLTWRTTHTAVIETCNMLPDFWHHYTAIEAFYRKEEADFGSQSSEKKFDDIWNNRRNLFSRVKKEYLASYCGMSMTRFEQYRKSK